VVAGENFSGLVQSKFGVAQPLVAIGAPVGAYYPEVARRLATPLSIPEHAAVCNAVGAVAGVVSQSITVLVNQPTFKLFRVHDPAGSLDFQEPEAAIEHARRVSRELALAAALRAAHSALGDDYLAEASVCSTATGRPLLGAAPVN
jgi:N-methylhydantoinase A/oxoprolinase/acetone carboxylase beta subunit